MEIIKVINDSSHGKIPPCHYGIGLLRGGAQPGDTVQGHEGDREQKEDSLLPDQRIMLGNKYCFSEASFSQE